MGDPECEVGMLGCKADGVNPQCRFCAERPFETVPCPEHVAPIENACTWPQRGEPLVPHFWDESCEMGMLGCWADGIHAQCRFCGAGVYSEILSDTSADRSPSASADRRPNASTDADSVSVAFCAVPVIRAGRPGSIADPHRELQVQL